MKSRIGTSTAAQASGKNPVTEVFSIFVFGLSLFSLLALLTYNQGDPSIFSNVHGVPQNACGRVGAYLSALLLQFFGLGSFLLPAALFFISATIFKREGTVRLVGTLGGMAVAVMALTVFVTLQWKYWPYAGSLLLTGGAFGAWVAAMLIKHFNLVGASIVSALVFCLAIALSTPVSVSRMGAVCFRFVGGWTWKIGRLLFTYFAYLLGLFAMRSAHAIADGMQRLLEATVRRARERAAAIADARRVAVAADAAFEAAEAAEAAEVTGVAARPSPPIEIPRATLIDDEPAFATKAESEDGADTQRAVAAGVTGEFFGREPTILPRLASEPIPEGEAPKPTLGGRMASRLARMRSKKGNWNLPTVEFLRKPPKIESAIDKERLIANSKILEQKLADFDIQGEVMAVRPGPVITLYEFKPAPGIKVSRIASLSDDLSMALSAQSVRILAPLPGKAVVGIEIPSETRETVYLREFLQHPDFFGPKHMIPIVMGKDIGGQTTLSDLYKMPHLLCAGQTGSGKSVFMNGLICSLLYRFTPDELRMILVDPKFIEFRSYQDIPHLLLPVVDDPKHASTALKWAVREMERRYRILAQLNVRHVSSFNQKVDEMGADVVRDLLLAEENQPETPLPGGAGSDWMAAFEPDEEGAPRVGKLPYIVIIIDELADLMMTARKEVEISIARIAQKARAAGIHLVVATQRPSTDVITGLIKANLPSRVSFQLASYVDSKTILDRSGAERLLGQGDMLFTPPGISQMQRLHGAFVDDEEIEKITAFLKAQGKPAYREEILVDDDEDEDGEGMDDGDSDPIFDEAVELIKRHGHASASSLQRHFRIGYNRAARLIEYMEARGIVGPADGARPREVLLR